jgi:hypothetical protein
MLLVTRGNYYHRAWVPRPEPRAPLLVPIGELQKAVNDPVAVAMTEVVEITVTGDFSLLRGVRVPDGPIIFGTGIR